MAILGSRDFEYYKSRTRLTLGLEKSWTSNFHYDASQHVPVDCPKDPLVIVIGGQSNAANSIQPKMPDRTERGVMFRDGRCYALESPVLGSTGENGSLWPSLGDRIATTTGRPVLIAAGAVGGSQIGDFLDRRSGYLDTLLNQLNELLEAGFSPDMVIWIQGETDAKVLRSGQDYADSQKALIARFNAANVGNEPVPWLLFLTTRCKDRMGSYALEAALARLAIEDPQVHIGPTLTNIDGRFRHDGCHFNPAGRDLIVERTMAALESEGLIEPAGDMLLAKGP